MPNFDEAWLRSHQAKMAAGKPLAGFTGREIRFTLARPVKLLNVTQRMHWSARRRYAKELSAEIAVLAWALIPPQPWSRATVRIERWSIKEPDKDNLYASAKCLVDCLLPRSTRHPHGLGFVVDDSPDHMDQTVVHKQAATRKQQSTTVIIEKVGE